MILLFRFQVVKAAQGKIPVFLDGGVRRGTDVFKALALGASGIFVSAKRQKFLAKQETIHCPWDTRNPIFILVNFLMLCWETDRTASGVLVGGGRRGWSEESATDDERRVRTHNGTKWMH